MSLLMIYFPLLTNDKQYNSIISSVNFMGGYCDISSLFFIVKENNKDKK